MRKTSCTPLAAAAVACSIASGFAAAQENVTIYGIMDIGLMYQTNNAVNGKSQTTVASSGLRQSIIGFKGTENLGNGLKAFFNLEAHFDVDTGRFHDGGDVGGAGNTMFRRQSNVGLSGDWGSVAVGRQYGPALLAHLATEPRIFKENFSNLYGWAYGQINTLGVGLPSVGSNAVSVNNDVGIFFNNAIQYRNAFGPVTVGVLYAPGETTGHSQSHGEVGAVGINYSGPLNVSFSYQEMKDDTTGHSAIKHTGLGLSYAFGDFTIKGNYLQAKNYNSLGIKAHEFNDYGLGLDYKWSQNNTLTVAYYDNEDDMNSRDYTHNVVISNDYSLSKRTTLYAVLANVKAGSGATFGTSIVAGAPYLAGSTTTFLNAGINHVF